MGNIKTNLVFPFCASIVLTGCAGVHGANEDASKAIHLSRVELQTQKRPEVVQPSKQDSQSINSGSKSDGINHSALQFPSVSQSPETGSLAEINKTIDTKIEKRISLLDNHLSDSRAQLEDVAQNLERLDIQAKTIEGRVLDVESGLKTEQTSLDAVRHEIKVLREETLALVEKNRLLEEQNKQNNADVGQISQRLEGVEQKQERINDIETHVSSQDLWYKILLILLAIAFVAIVYLFFKLSRMREEQKKICLSQEELRKKQVQLSENITQADASILELLEKSIDKQNLNVTKATAENHSLAIKVADEIVRIELNISRMAPDTKGLKQISRAVKRIKDNFLANGYEIVDMIGKPYNEGMKVIANFVQDEDLNPGEQIISGIVKPQINHNGKMIQAAQVTVSQNI